jgi:superfamily I DNA/RNA helicase
MIYTKEQEQAIINNNIRIKIIANPGSGKTFTIIQKYIYMINNNIISNSKTIIISYTKKSAKELETRLLNKNIPLPKHVGTIHKLCLKILKEYFDINYIIIDDDISKEYILKVLKKLKINEKKLNKIKKVIDYAKTFYPINIEEACKKNKINLSVKIIELINKTYNASKKVTNKIDFGDILQLLMNKLTKNKEILEKILLDIDCIFFDEFQDINMIQSCILELLSKNKRVVVVGDPNQAIYGFRGANKEFIANFKGVEYRLNENFRSTKRNISILNSIYPKSNNITNNRIGSKPIYKKYNNFYELLSDVKISKDSIIITRFNSDLDLIEKLLLEKDINYVRNNAISQRSHSKLFILLLQLIIKRNMIIKNFILTEYSKIINSSILKNIKSVEDIYEFLIKVYEEKKDINDICMIYNLYKKKKINSINETIEFINNLTLDNNNVNYDKLTLSTIHGSKGLEYKNVYFLLDGFSKEELTDEQMRLIYVGCSRVKSNLLLFNVNEKQNKFIKNLDPLHYNI